MKRSTFSIAVGLCVLASESYGYSTWTHVAMTNAAYAQSRLTTDPHWFNRPMNAYLVCRSRLRATLLLVMLIACCGGCSAAPMVTGKIIDGETGTPLEGAYVMAEYTEGGGDWFGHSATWCVRTRGMYTLADGSFHVPNDGRSVPLLFVIRPDYTFYQGVNYRDSDPNEAYQILYLQRQDPAHPKLIHGFDLCQRPKIADDVAALIEFGKIELQEMIKYDPSHATEWRGRFNYSVELQNRTLESVNRKLNH